MTRLATRALAASKEPTLCTPEQSTLRAMEAHRLHVCEECGDATPAIGEYECDTCRAAAMEDPTAMSGIWTCSLWGVTEPVRATSRRSAVSTRDFSWTLQRPCSESRSTARTSWKSGASCARVTSCTRTAPTTVSSMGTIARNSEMTLKSIFGIRLRGLRSAASSSC